MALKFNPFTGTLDYVESGATKEKAEGVPAGGETSAVLTKHSATNYDDEWAKIKNANVAAAAGIEESKLSIPEMVKLTGLQTITGEKVFEGPGIKINQIAATGASPAIRGFSEILGTHTMSLGKGNFSIEEEEKVLFGPESSSKLKQVTLSGEVVANSTAFSTAPDFTYGVIPEASAVLESAVAGNKHRTMLLVNISTTETLTIVHEAAGAQKGLASNRFHFASEENVKLAPGEAIWLWYTEGEASGAKERWRDLGAWSINLPRPSAGTGLERAAGNVFAVKPGGIKEASLENESVTFPKLAFFNADAPIEIPAGKTYEVPSNVQGLWKESISVQGTLNIQGRFDEVGTPEGLPTLREIELNAKEFTENVTFSGFLTVAGESKLKALECTTLKANGEARLKSKTVVEGILEAKGVLTEVFGSLSVREAGKATFAGPVECGKTLELKELPVPQATPTEVPENKTYEVPTNTQALWKDNVSVQGTLNVQGRFDEVGATEGSPWFLPTVVTETQNIPVSAETWFRFSKVNGTVNVQGELIGTT